MSFDKHAQRQAQRVAEADTHSAECLAPPWVRYPSYTRYTIGWRMGSGEDWMWRWGQAIEPLDAAARYAYFKSQRPAPKTWASFVWQALDPSRSFEAEPNAEALMWLAAEGLIGDDVAYGNWRASLDQDSPSPPWAQVEDEEALRRLGRYQPRALFFYGRYAQDEGHAPPPPLPCPSTTAGYARLAWEARLNPWLPAPWQWGEMASEGAAGDYGHAWRSWISACFDDAVMWQAYRSRLDPPHGAWLDFVAAKWAELDQPRP